jgi:hypothetical protein
MVMKWASVDEPTEVVLLVPLATVALGRSSNETHTSLPGERAK